MKKCLKCNAKMKEVKVKIQDGDSLVTSYQCSKCGYFDFEGKSMEKAIAEIKDKEMPLKIKQKIIKLSHEMLLIEKIKKTEEQIEEGKFVKANTKMSDEGVDDLLMN